MVCFNANRVSFESRPCLGFRFMASHWSSQVWRSRKKWPSRLQRFEWGDQIVVSLPSTVICRSRSRLRTFHAHAQNDVNKFGSARCIKTIIVEGSHSFLIKYFHNQLNILQFNTARKQRFIAYDKPETYFTKLSSLLYNLRKKLSDALHSKPSCIPEQIKVLSASHWLSHQLCTQRRRKEKQFSVQTMQVYHRKYHWTYFDKLDCCQKSNKVNVTFKMSQSWTNRGTLWSRHLPLIVSLATTAAETAMLSLSLVWARICSLQRYAAYRDGGRRRYRELDLLFLSRRSRRRWLFRLSRSRMI